MGFSFDGITSKSMGIASRMAEEKRVPELKNHTIQVAGRDGVLDLGSSLSERVIGISCFIPPKRTMAGLLKCKDDIVSWLSPDKGVCALMLDTEPGRVYYARLQEGVAFERVVRLAATFDLTFFCPDPYGYAAEDEVFSITAQGNHVVNRTLGNLYSNPVYRLKGILASGAGRYISIITNGVELRIANAVLSASETLVVDTAKMTAWVEDADGNTLRNALPYISELNFPTLDAGLNTVEVAASNATFTELEIQAKSRWR
ncbi:MAG: phage tail family protein [Lachnospiraceae bacterium]|nr:phage tail family protein [Lachnospiraceae bacterium]